MLLLVLVSAGCLLAGNRARLHGEHQAAEPGSTDRVERDALGIMTNAGRARIVRMMKAPAQRASA
ncbi:MAG: hypothetical protein ABI870_01010 [Rhodanobacter sp.]